MNRSIISLLIIFLLSIPAFAGISTNHAISTEVLGGGGENSTSTHFLLHGKTRGTAYDTPTSTNHMIGEGFLHSSFDAMTFLPIIYTISPSSSNNKGIVSVTITGINFTNGASVELSLLGQPSITGDAVIVVSSNRIECDFDLRGVTLGKWDIRVTNPDGSTYVLRKGFNIFITTGAPKIKGRPANYPSPFDPDKGGNVTIRYELNRDAPIVFTVHNISGTRIFQQTYPAGGNGGKAGLNEILWDGYTVFSEVVPNGVYVYQLSSGGETLATGKIAVFR